MILGKSVRELFTQEFGHLHHGVTPQGVQQGALFDELPHFFGLSFDLTAYGEDDVSLGRLVDQPRGRFQLMNGLLKAVTVNAIGKDAQQLASLRPWGLDRRLGRRGRRMADLNVAVFASGANLDAWRAATE